MSKLLEGCKVTHNIVLLTSEIWSPQGSVTEYSTHQFPDIQSPPDNQGRIQTLLWCKVTPIILENNPELQESNKIKAIILAESGLNSPNNLMIIFRMMGAVENKG